LVIRTSSPARKHEIPLGCQYGSAHSRDRSPAISTSPIEIVGEWLQNLLDPEVVNKVVAPDATYVSLNTEDSELKRILTWAGTSHGPDAFIWNLSEMFRYWRNENFEVTTMFGEGENVAVFGTFTYRSNTLGNVVTSPFSIHVKVVDGKVTHLQFLEGNHIRDTDQRSAGHRILPSRDVSKVRLTQRVSGPDNGKA